MKRCKDAPPSSPEPPEPPASRAWHDRHEVARFQREQPPAPIPRRTYAPAVPGLVALSVLGARVIRRLD